MPKARWLGLMLIPAVLAAASPARAADCVPDRTADQVFHPYGEPAVPCSAQPEPAAPPLDREHEDVLGDDRGSRPLQNLGISGMQGGASIAAVGGLFLLSSLLVDDDARAWKVFHWGGIGLAAAGGAVFVAGGALLVADYVLTPAPTPDRRGAQLMLAFRF